VCGEGTRVILPLEFPFILRSQMPLPLRFLAPLVLLVLLASCSPNGAKRFVAGDIVVSDARALALLDNSASPSTLSASSDSNLIKIRADGSSSDPIRDDTIDQVHNVWRLGPHTILYVQRLVPPEYEEPDDDTPPDENGRCEFLLLAGQDTYKCLTLHAYFLVPGNHVPDDMPFQLDGEDNIYYMSVDNEGQAVFKYDVSTGETIVVVPGYLPFYLNAFAVAPDGTVYLDGYMQGDDDNHWIRRVSPNGDVAHVVDQGPYSMDGFVAVHGDKLYLIVDGLDGVRQIELTNHQLLPHPFLDGGNDGESGADFTEAETGASVAAYMGGVHYPAGDRIFTLFEDRLQESFPTPHAIDIPVARVTRAAYWEEGLYILGETGHGTEVVAQVDLATEATTVLLEVSSQDLNYLVVDGAAKAIYFDALRLSPLEYRLGRLDLLTNEVTYRPLSTGFEKVLNLD
jgi:hypothetical protein